MYTLFIGIFRRWDIYHIFFIVYLEKTKHWIISSFSRFSKQRSKWHFIILRTVWRSPACHIIYSTNTLACKILEMKVILLSDFYSIILLMLFGMPPKYPIFLQCRIWGILEMRYRGICLYDHPTCKNVVSSNLLPNIRWRWWPILR